VWRLASIPVPEQEQLCLVNVVTQCLPDRLTRVRGLPTLRLTYKRDYGPAATQIAAPYCVFISALRC